MHYNGGCKFFDRRTLQISRWEEGQFFNGIGFWDTNHGQNDRLSGSRNKLLQIVLSNSNNYWFNGHLKVELVIALNVIAAITSVWRTVFQIYGIHSTLFFTDCV